MRNESKTIYIARDKDGTYNIFLKEPKDDNWSDLYGYWNGSEVGVCQIGMHKTGLEIDEGNFVEAKLVITSDEYTYRDIKEVE